MLHSAQLLDSGGWSIGGATPMKLAREEADFNMFKNKLNIFWKLIPKLHLVVLFDL